MLTLSHGNAALALAATAALAWTIGFVLGALI